MYAYKYVVACPGNTATSTSVDGLCPNAVTACAGAGADTLLWFLFRSPAAPAPPDWTQVGTRCLTFEQATAGPAAGFPGFTLADFQRLPLPPGAATVQPNNGYTLIGVPTNVYATAAPVVLGTTVAGFPVQVRARPSTYEWAFGDGTTTGPTSETGAPYPALTLAHTYTTAADVAITLTTRYSGEYSVAGGDWLPIAGEAQVTSPPVPVAVLSGRNALVGDLAGADPAGAPIGSSSPPR